MVCNDMGFYHHEKVSMTKPEREEASSSAPPSYDTLPSNFGIVSLHMSDKIRCIGFDELELDAIQEIVTSSWTKGIAKTRPYNESFEIQVVGNPWNSVVNPDRERRALVRNILRGLYEIGWAFESSITLTRKVTEKGESKSGI